MHESLSQKLRGKEVAAKINESLETLVRERFIEDIHSIRVHFPIGKRRNFVVDVRPLNDRSADSFIIIAAEKVNVDFAIKPEFRVTGHTGKEQITSVDQAPKLVIPSQPTPPLPQSMPEVQAPVIVGQAIQEIWSRVLGRITKVSEGRRIGDLGLSFLNEECADFVKLKISVNVSLPGFKESRIAYIAESILDAVVNYSAMLKRTAEQPLQLPFEIDSVKKDPHAVLQTLVKIGNQAEGLHALVSILRDIDDALKSGEAREFERLKADRGTMVADVRSRFIAALHSPKRSQAPLLDVITRLKGLHSKSKTIINPGTGSRRESTLNFYAPRNTLTKVERGAEIACTEAQKLGNEGLLSIYDWAAEVIVAADAYWRSLEVVPIRCITSTTEYAFLSRWCTYAAAVEERLRLSGLLPSKGDSSDQQSLFARFNGRVDTSGASMMFVFPQISYSLSPDIENDKEKLCKAIPYTIALLERLVREAPSN